MPKAREQIDPQVFEHLVKLAALQLDEKQAEYLEAIPIPEGLSITVHGVPYPSNTNLDLRDDQWQPFPNSADIVDQAPQSENNQFAVPDIPHTTLE
jgi:aspartyl-tRNA(Asn)/glutamyl-tRNA(Gln) amidotransferase subunit C